MRINVYSQEIVLDEPPTLVIKRGTDDEGNPATFYGVRFNLHSSDRLHFNENDDDRSAVIFWLPKSNDNIKAVASLFSQAGSIVGKHVLFGTP